MKMTLTEIINETRAFAKVGGAIIGGYVSNFVTGALIKTLYTLGKLEEKHLLDSTSVKQFYDQIMNYQFNNSDEKPAYFLFTILATISGAKSAYKFIDNNWKQKDE